MTISHDKIKGQSCLAREDYCALQREYALALQTQNNAARTRSHLSPRTSAWIRARVRVTQRSAYLTTAAYLTGGLERGAER